LRQRVASPRQNSRAACGGSALEEVSPAQRFWLLKLWLFAACVALLGHLGSSPEICCLPFMQWLKRSFHDRRCQRSYF
jgi:hypothetical protein